MPSLGSSLSSGVFGPFDVAEKDVDGERLERTYRAEWASWRSTLPTIGDAHPDNAAALYQRARVRRLESNGDLCDVTLEYEELPEQIQIENVSAEEIDIRRHPNYDAVSDADRAEVEAALTENRATTATGAALELYQKLLQGINSYVVGSLEVTQTDFYTTDPGSQAGSVGTLIYPDGYSPSTLWLCVGASKQRQGAWWVRTLVLRYSARGWDSDLY